MLVADRIEQLTSGVANFYAIEDGGRLTLVDAGGAADLELFLAWLSTLGRTLADLDAVLLTHAHSDHVGFAERARTDAPATVWIHHADVEAATSGVVGKNEAGYAKYLLRPEAYRTLFGLMGNRGLKIVPVREVSAFGDGETIDVPGSPRVIHTPGHTAGTCSVLIESRRTLLTGDAMSTRNPLTGRRGPQIGPDGLNADSAGALRSLDVLEALPADLVLPGHGDPWTDGVAEAVRLARIAGRS